MSFPVNIKVDSTKHIRPLNPIWRFFGADEPNYAYMKDGEKLLSTLGQLGCKDSSIPRPNQVYFRTHNLLTTGDGTPALKWGSTNAYTEDSSGNPIYDWTIIDRIFDTYLERGIKPYVQIGFMPEALSIHPEPYQHDYNPRGDYNDIYTGWTYPPKSYEKWEELVFRWTEHCVEKYGKEEVQNWYWEVWNEPNIGYWSGSDEEFFKLYDCSVKAVRRALPTAKIGGPEVAEGGVPLLTSFLKHCGYQQDSPGANPQEPACSEIPQEGKPPSRDEIPASEGPTLPLDFVSFHSKGRPEYISTPDQPNSHVRMGLSHHLKEINSAFEIISSFPQLRSTPIVIGESDPEGAAAAQGPQLSYRNSPLYSSYTASIFTHLHHLSHAHNLNLTGALTWSFEFESQPYFAGFRVLSTNGIHLPVLNVFKLFSLMGDTEIEAVSDGMYSLDRVLKEGIRGEFGDVGVLASVFSGEKEKEKIAILLYHYHDDDTPGLTADVKLDVRVTDKMGEKDEFKLTHYRIDENHSNAFRVWKEMGEPQELTGEEYKGLRDAGELAVWEEKVVRVGEGGVVNVEFELVRQGVLLLVFEGV